MKILLLLLDPDHTFVQRYLELYNSLEARLAPLRFALCAVNCLTTQLSPYLPPCLGHLLHLPQTLMTDTNISCIDSSKVLAAFALCFAMILIRIHS